MSKAIRIKSLSHLKKILGKKPGEPADCVLALNFGLRSSKVLTYDGDDMFSILNLIDDSEQELNSKQMMNKKHTNIGEAITKGAFFFEEWA